MDKNNDNNKTIFRLKKSDNFVMIDRYLLEDERLTYEAKGLLASMLSKPNNWTFYFRHFTEKSPSGKDKVRRIFHELIQFGYLVKRELRNQKGRFNSTEYLVYESPLKENQQGDGGLPKPENTLLEKSVLDNSLAKNPPLLKKHLTNIQNTKDTTNQETANQSTAFIWAKKLSKADQSAIHNLLVGVVDINIDLKQLLLDELAGQLDWIKNPVGYFRTLLKSCQRGEFVPDKALNIQTDRNRQRENELAVERTQQYHEEQMLSKMQKYLQKRDV